MTAKNQPLKVVIAQNDNPYSEAVSAGFRFALLAEDGRTYHHPIQCKDYFTDLAWIESQNKEATVFGFNWKPRPGFLDKPWHLMAISQKGLVAKAANLQRFLNEIESTLGFPTCTIEPDSAKAWLIVRFSRVWWLRPYLISAFTQYLRCGASYEGGGVVNYLKDMGAKNLNPWCTYDGYRLPTVAERTAMMLSGSIWDQKYSDYPSAGHAHGQAGLISFTMSSFPLTKK